VKQHVDEVMIGTKWLTECVGKSSCHGDSCAAHRRDYCVQSSRLELCQHGFQNRSSCQIRVVPNSRCLVSCDSSDNMSLSTADVMRPGRSTNRVDYLRSPEACSVHVGSFAPVRLHQSCIPCLNFRMTVTRKPDQTC